MPGSDSGTPRRGEHTGAASPSSRGRLPYISRELKERVRVGSEIQQVVGEHVDLKRSGRNFVGLCPFHCEKTPSFVVSPERRSFRCFGCGASGDVFTFVARIERTDFLGAVRLLASRTGIALTASTVASHEAEAQQIEQQRITQAAEVLVNVENATLREQRREVHRLIALRHQAAIRLEEIDGGSAPRFPDEAATAWAALQLVASMLRRAEAAYCIASFAAASTR